MAVRRDPHLASRFDQSGDRAGSPICLSRSRRPLNRKDELHLVCRSLTVHDHKRNPGVWISSESTGPEILLYGPDRKPRVALEASAQRGAVNILGDDGEPRVQLFTHEDHGHLLVRDDKGKPRAGIKAADIGGVVSVTDAKGKPLAYLHGDKSGVMT